MDKRTHALALRLEGLTYQEIGASLGISRQRVQQLTSPPKEIRHLVVERAGGRCQICGLTVLQSGHVHHVRATAGYAENYNDLPNLQLLCRSCHRAAHHVSASQSERGYRVDSRLLDTLEDSVPAAEKPVSRQNGQRASK